MKKIRFSASFCLLLGVACMTGCNLNFVFDGQMFSQTGEKATSQEAGEIGAEITRIVVKNRFGDVTVQTTDGETGWQWDKTVWADTTALAELTLEDFNISVTTDANVQTWEVVIPSQKEYDFNGAQSNLVINVNAETSANINNSFGEVNAKGLTADVAIDLQHGDLKVANLSNLKAQVQHGDSNVRDIDGVFEINQQHGDLVANTISGDVNVSSQHGEATIYDINGDNVQVKVQHGDADVSIVNSDFSSVSVDSSHGDLEVSIPEGVAPKVNMSVSHGDKYSNVESNNGSAQLVDLDASHGDVGLRYSKSVTVSE